jgi:hypothetical protein
MGIEVDKVVEGQHLAGGEEPTRQDDPRQQVRGRAELNAYEPGEQPCMKDPRCIEAAVESARQVGDREVEFLDRSRTPKARAASSGLCSEVGRKLDPDHAASRPNAFSKCLGDQAWAATRVDHASTWRDADSFPCARWLVEPEFMLHAKPIGFGIVGTEDAVDGLVHEWTVVSRVDPQKWARLDPSR